MFELVHQIIICYVSISMFHFEEMNIANFIHNQSFVSQSFPGFVAGIDKIFRVELVARSLAKAA